MRRSIVLGRVQQALIRIPLGYYLVLGPVEGDDKKFHGTS